MAVFVAGVVFFVVMFAVVGLATVIQYLGQRSHNRTMRRMARSRFVTELTQEN